MSTYSTSYICRTKWRALFVCVVSHKYNDCGSNPPWSARMPHWHWVSYPPTPPPPSRLLPSCWDSSWCCLFKHCARQGNTGLRQLGIEVMLSVWRADAVLAASALHLLLLCLTTTEMGMARAKATTTITMLALYSSRQTQSKCPSARRSPSWAD